MVATMLGRTSAVEGKSTRRTVPVQTRLQGSGTGILKTISIRLRGSIHSSARNRTSVDPIFSVYPKNHGSAPRRRNSTGRFISNCIFTRVRMHRGGVLVHATKVLSHSPSRRLHGLTRIRKSP